MRDWLEKTHGTLFELLRHFLSRFFDNDLVTAPGHVAPVLIGAFSLFLPWFQILLAPLRAKYAYLSGLGDPQYYRHAVLADELWLITLMMSAIGLMTAVKWQSLFPDARDHRSLACLPLRTYQIFLAKLLALFLMASAAIPTLNVLPSLLFPILSDSRWSINPSLGSRALAQLVASAAGSYFFFFALIAVQGVLLLFLGSRLFRAVAGYLQGALVSAMLVLLVMSFSIQPAIADRALKPNVGCWIPPVWFLGLYHRMLGDSDPQMQKYASLATAGLFASIFIGLATYFASYHRYRQTLADATPFHPKSQPIISVTFGWLINEPRQNAVVSFIVKTLAGSSQHRMILMGYLGFGFAILMSGSLGIRNLVQPDRLVSATFVYAHLILLVFLLAGFRHLFAIPTELRANWIFRITEQEGRREWLAAVDRFVLHVGGIGLFLSPLPVELKLLGLRGMAESVLLGMVGLLCFECMFYSWEKMPFTCSRLPGKFPIWIRTLQLFGLIAVLTPAASILIASLYNSTLFVTIFLGLLVSWILAHQNRIETRADLPLKYEEFPEPAVISLRLLK